ncbi:MAG: ABC transporter permease subunit [Sphingomonadaceae bacterium]
MRVLAVLQKELLEILRHKMLLFSLIPLPLLFVAIPLVMILLTRDQPVDPREAEIYTRLSPDFAHLPPGDVIQMMLVGQFLFILLMVPVIVPMTIATFSVIGEKQARSLEPLLATPIRTWELLLGKALAATLPAVVATWLAYGILIVGIAILASPLVLASAASPMWLLAILIIAPLLALLGVNLGILMSSRFNDTRVAQQIGGLVVLPLVGLGMVQVMGIVLYNLPMFLAGAVALAALDAGVLMVAVKLFQRETILTRWK